ncbi:MAG: transporter substrate-binding domain-containing protein [Alphaproteobacteria bacterium]
MRRTLTALVGAAALALTVGAAQGKDWKQVKIGTEGAYPPWNSTNADGQLVGAEIDLAMELCKRMGVTCEVVAQDWDGIIPALKNGKYDAIMAGMSITEERMTQINFSRGYFNDPARLAVLKDSELAGLETVENLTLDDIDAAEQETLDKLKTALSGKTVGVQIATIHQNFVEKYLGDAVDLRTYQTQDELNLDLQVGRIDVALADNGAFADFMEKAEGENIVLTGPKMSGDVFGAGVGVGIRKEDEDLLALFNKAIEEATADGTVGRISKDWFGFDLSMQ